MIGEEIADLLDSESAEALRRWSKLNHTELRYAGWADRGNTSAVVISAYASRAGMDTRKLVLKIAPRGRTESPEPRRHRDALAVSPEKFRARHLVELPWDTIPFGDEGWIMFQEIASGSLDEIRPLSTILADPDRSGDAARACTTVVSSMLTEWTPTVRAMDPYPTAGSYLRALLGCRLERGGTVRSWAEANGVLSSEPFALIQDDLLTKGEKLHVRIGHVHGDAHPGNVLIPRDPAEYRLIDLSRFASDQPLALDPIYLQLTIVAPHLPDFSDRERDSVARLLVSPTAERRDGVPPAVHDVITAISRAANEWAALRGLRDEWRRETLLTMIGCALIMTGREILPRTSRDWFYGLAGLATTTYLEGSVPARPVPAAAWAPEPEPAIETTVLPAGTRLWRVHPRSTPIEKFTDDPAGRRTVLRASRREATALLEELLRGVSFGDNGDRQLQLTGMRLSALRTTRDIVLASAEGEPDLVGLWPPDGVQGVEWPSARDLPEPTMVLLGDRCPPGSIRAGHWIELDTPDRAVWLRELLRPYRVRVPDPPASGPLIFVTGYPWDDHRAIGKIGDELRAWFGHTAVFDSTQTLPAGVDVATERLHRLSAAKVLLVVVGTGMFIPSGPEVNDRAVQVRHEISVALRNGGHVVPVLVARLDLPAEALPTDVRKLAALQPLRLPSLYTKRDIEALVTQLVEDVPGLGE